MESWRDVKLDITCNACPEQYDAYIDDDEIIGYLRLRHGLFSVYYRNDVVYQAYPEGDGIFCSDERTKYLKKAKKAIYKAHKKYLNPPQRLNKLKYIDISRIADILDDSDLNRIEKVVKDKSNDLVEDYLKSIKIN